MKSKKVFTYCNVPCVSAGVIFYKIVNGQVFLLLQTRYDRRKKCIFIEDLGGKSNPEDRDIIDVAARESAEESNGAIYRQYMDGGCYASHINRAQQYISELIRRRVKAFINKRNKYVTFLVQLDPHAEFFFDNHEYGQPYFLARSITWFPLECLKKIDRQYIHPRIKHFYRLIDTATYDGLYT